ncbi:MAG: phytoene desaturase family protein, partial [Anaerolineales bacterium]
NVAHRTNYVTGEKMTKTEVDAIVIGSGAGGLTAAVCLAQAGLKVIVCEQHNMAGGWCHSFTLQGYRFSPGVHYIGGLQPGGSLRRVYEGLGVSRDLTFCELNPDGFDHIVIGDEQFDIPKGKDNFAARLKARFPHEKKGIDGYLDAVSDIMWKLRKAVSVKSVGGAAQLLSRSPALVRWGLRSGQDLIEHYVSDPLLKAILAGQSGDHGSPPSLVSATIHAGIVHHYFEGAYYPLGGGFAIPRAFVRALKRAGGEIMLKARVARILLEGRRAIGVQLEDGTEIRARYVVSNADPEVTLGQLVGREHLSKRLRRKLDRVRYSVSCLSLFLAVDMDLRTAGLDSGNYWLYDHEDLNLIYQQGMTDHALKAETPPAFFLTATTLKDPSKMHSGHHTLEAFTFVGYDAFKKWAREETGRRSVDYRTLKGQLADQMLAGLDKHVPGLRERVVFCDIGTPLTNEQFIGVTYGSLYGIEKSRFQVGPGAFPIRTELDGLYMCGASTLSHGVSGVTASGLAAARKILNCRTSELLQMKGPEIRIYPSEDISQWPENLQKKIQRGQKRTR